MKKLFYSVLVALLFTGLFFQGSAVNAAEQTIKGQYPRVILSSYSIDEPIKYDEENIMHLTFTNTSQYIEVCDVLVTYTSDNGTISPVMGSSNQIFIRSIKAGENVNIDVPVVIRQGGYVVAHGTFNLSYIAMIPNVEGMSNYQFSELILSNSSIIRFDLPAVGSITATSVEISSSVQQNDRSFISVTYQNDGSINLYNVKLVVNDSLGNVKYFAIGNVKAGKGGVVENYISFEEVGVHNLSFGFSYEDEEGNSFGSGSSMEYPVTVVEKKAAAVSKPASDNVENNVSTGTENDNLKDTDNEISLSIIIIVAGVVLIVGIIIAVIVGSRRRDRF